jgi:hypothetical protein
MITKNRLNYHYSFDFKGLNRDFVKINILIKKSVKALIGG